MKTQLEVEYKISQIETVLLTDKNTATEDTLMVGMLDALHWCLEEQFDLVKLREKMKKANPT